MVRKKTDRFLSVRETIRMLHENGNLNMEEFHQIDRLRTFRNTLVLKPKEDETEQFKKYFLMLDDILKRLKKLKKQKKQQG